MTFTVLGQFWTISHWFALGIGELINTLYSWLHSLFPASIPQDLWVTRGRKEMTEVTLCSYIGFIDTSTPWLTSTQSLTSQRSNALSIVPNQHQGRLPYKDIWKESRHLTDLATTCGLFLFQMAASSSELILWLLLLWKCSGFEFKFKSQSYKKVIFFPFTLMSCVLFLAWL